MVHIIHTFWNCRRPCATFPMNFPALVQKLKTRCLDIMGCDDGEDDSDGSSDAAAPAESAQASNQQGDEPEIMNEEGEWIKMDWPKGETIEVPDDAEKPHQQEPIEVPDDAEKPHQHETTARKM